MLSFKQSVIFSECYDIKLSGAQFQSQFLPGQELESEGNDRATMDLAGNQTQLIKDALRASELVSACAC